MPPRPSWRLSGLTVRQLAVAVWTAAQTDEVVHRSAALSYAFLFSCFPLLLFMVAMLSLMPVHHVIRQLMESAAQVLPEQAATAVRGTLRQVIANSGQRGLVSVGAVTALWAGSTGLLTVMSMLNVVNHVRDERPWWMRRGIAMALTVLLAAFLIAATSLTMLGAQVGAAFGIASGTLTTVVPIVLVLLAVDVVYYIAPVHRSRRPALLAVAHAGVGDLHGAVAGDVLWAACLRRELRDLRRDVRGDRRRDPAPALALPHQRRSIDRRGGEQGHQRCGRPAARGPGPGVRVRTGTRPGRRTAPPDPPLGVRPGGVEAATAAGRC